MRTHKLKPTLLKKQKELNTANITDCGWLIFGTFTYVQLLFPTSHPPPSPTLFCCLSLTAALRSSWSLADLPASINVIMARHTHHSFWCGCKRERGAVRWKGMRADVGWNSCPIKMTHQPGSKTGRTTHRLLLLTWYCSFTVLTPVLCVWEKEKTF